MDVDHSGVDQKVIEKPGKSDADLIHDGEDSSDEAGQKERKTDYEDDSDEDSKSSESDEKSNIGGSDNKAGGESTNSEGDAQEG
eukprot:2784391-Ditylum_brightwellii.AAC.1